MAIRISSCSKSPTRFSSCKSAFLAGLPYIHPHFLSVCRPGDYLKPGEDDVEGLKRRLDERLAPPPESKQFNASHGVDNEWEIGDCLAQWWRPNFETFMVSNPMPSWSDLSIFFPVPIHTCAYNQTKGMQKAIFGAYARTQYVSSQSASH